MPIVYSVLEDERLVITDWSGSVDDDEAVAAYERLYVEPSWKPGFDELADLRTCDLNGITTAGLKRIAEVATAAAGTVTSRVAAITDRELSYGLVRMYELLSAESPETVQIFHDPAEAAKWLGVAVEVVAPDA